ncbi:MAG: hypothetical protein JWN14_4609, partial [Chthonomonadales bacterium]|nr:hypothetical protein [Chthonomonadales bacterium]
MTAVNQRLTEHRSQPLRRTIGDAFAGSAITLLALNLLDTRNSYNFIIPPILLTIWFYNRNLHALDLANAALNLQEFDHRWIGPLFEALSWPNRRIRKIVRLKLLNLLPMVKEEDSLSISQKHRWAIYAALEHSQDIELKIAILKALVRIGDNEAVPVVERIANARVWTLAGRRVRNEALACLPRLREQALKFQERFPVSTASARPLPLGQDGISSLTDSQNPTAASVLDAATKATLEAEREKVSRPAMRVAFLVANWGIIVPYTAFQAVTSFADHQPLLGFCWTGLSVLTSQLYRVSLSRRRVSTMRKQAQQRDPKAVGQLAEALSWPDQDLQYEAASALTVLLPMLKANDASLLSAAQRECLHHELTLPNARTQSELMVAILQAFQQVGDNAAIPYVESLAVSKPRTPQEQKVVQEAQECLPYLRLCASNNSASHSLLRASSFTDTATDNLLRPSWDNPETRPEQLLRPSDQDAK